MEIHSRTVDTSSDASMVGNSRLLPAKKDFEISRTVTGELEP
jgi:hypothetical protein